MELVVYLNGLLDKLAKFLKHELVVNIVNTTIAACAVVGIFVSLSQAKDNHKLLEITNSKFLQENRPYIYFDSVNWLGHQNSLFSLELKNPGQWPAIVTLSFSIKDTFGNELYSDEKDGIVIFPSNQSRVITIGYNTIIISLKDDPDKKIALVAYGKPIKKIQELLSAGENLDFTIVTKYSSLLGENRENSVNFKYQQRFLLYKTDSEVVIKNRGVDAY